MVTRPEVVAEVKAPNGCKMTVEITRWDTIRTVLYGPRGVAIESQTFRNIKKFNKYLQTQTNCYVIYGVAPEPERRPVG